MDAPPTYDEAILAKGQSGSNPLVAKPMGAPVGPHAPPFNPYYPPPQPGPVYAAPEAVPQSYQQPQMVTVTMVPTTTRTVIVEKHSSVNHCLHCLITLIFWPWIFVWIFLCLVSE
ncbi:uncharacterized protein LOC129584537 [Paramacrobiotus metropolitanus]|uniref:uncharacterized protein LOC129584537 n=1 Tax=Paramacrobiotus metropolitanus TaxID=2943436 RepID=UPI002445B70F|nr:uncharacterized protein LOC129584537 [Paramacrobiotus metropolitanus]